MGGGKVGTESDLYSLGILHPRGKNPDTYKRPEKFFRTKRNWERANVKPATTNVNNTIKMRGGGVGDAYVNMLRPNNSAVLGSGKLYDCTTILNI